GRLAEGGEPCAFERVDRDVDLRSVVAPNLLAVEEHRGLVLLPFADDDDAVHRNRVEHRAHRVYRSLVGRLLVAAADPAAGAHRRRLCHAHELEREVPVGRDAVHGTGPYIRSGASTPTRSRQRAITRAAARRSGGGNSSAPNREPLWSWRGGERALARERE